MKDYVAHALAEGTCQKRFALFENGDFVLKDEKRPRQLKKYEEEEMNVLLKGRIFGSHSSSHFQRIKAVGYIQM